ncbi:hypothetical protein [uncultured Roseobacter sp.]|uniref:hypothetical protein n=1 Tax=uncultured Roseobacter sp. TaxID=114847 RepID=UPI002602A7E6|nr:hypothetical protein [uncultured Roseobacter sp.]
MHHKRRPLQEITPASEDAGLFRGEICNQVIELVPQTRRTERGDLIIRGIVDAKYSIDVFFAGRRVKNAEPLERRLKSMLTNARAFARKEGGRDVRVDDLRWRVLVEGAWRRRTQRDESGWETGTYHLVVSRWSMPDEDGITTVFGEPPLKTPMSERPE